MILAWIARRLETVGHTCLTILPEGRAMEPSFSGWMKNAPFDAAGTMGRPLTLPLLQALCSEGDFDVILLHEPHSASFLEVDGAASDLPPIVGFVHTVICPGQRLLRRREQICPGPMGNRCFTRWYAGPCGSAWRPTSAWREVRAGIRGPRRIGRLRAVAVASRWMFDHLVAEGVDPRLIDVVDLPSLLNEMDWAFNDTKEAAPTTLLYVGRLAPAKGLHRLIEALPLLASDVTLRICGDGFQRTELVGLVAERGLERQVHFDGWVAYDRLPSIYAESSLLVVPSLWPEPLGAVVAEAATQGLPALVANRGGLPEWAEILPATRIVNIDSRLQLVGAISDVLRNRERSRSSPKILPHDPPRPTVEEVLCNVV